MGGPPVKKLALAALGAGGRLLWAGARKGAGLVGGAVRHGALYYLTLWAAWRAGELNAKATWNADVLARLDEASPADLKAILGELPPWVHAADWDRVRAHAVAPVAPSRCPSRQQSPASRRGQPSSTN